MTLQQRIAEQELTGPNRPRHLDPEAPAEYPVPQYGEHDLIPSKNVAVWHPPMLVRG
jgi:NADH-quinone oxidoreductase subunit B